MAFGQCRRVWCVRAKQVGECRQVWRVLAKPLYECWLNQDRTFYAQITYFICIKLSSLHSLNLPNSPNSPKFALHSPFASLASPRNTAWRMSASLASPRNTTWQMLASLASSRNRAWRMLASLASLHISENGCFGKYSHSPKMASFARVLKFAKFAGE